MAKPWSSFFERFLTRASQCPDTIAIRGEGGQALRYLDLVANAERLAASLHARGVRRESVVALEMGRSPEFVVGVLAAWWLGAAFVPVDPSFPKARRALLVEGSGARVVVKAGDVMQASSQAAIPACRPRPEDLAYVLFTSGSTGRPKGVAVEQRGLVAVLEAQIAAFDLRPGDRVFWMLSPSFDASLSDLGTGLLSGATLIVAKEQSRDPDALVETLTDHQVTHVDMPPSLLPLLDPERMPVSLRTVVIGGEVCPPATVRHWARARRVVNVYGPTEATICTSLCVCDSERWSEPLLGQPFGEIRYHVLDDRQRHVAPGEVGELYIQGPCLARGYLDRPELTAGKFPAVEGKRLYRSGDRVRWRADGEYVFLGRIDRQVKLHGKLVEPGEVEACLVEHPGVRGAGAVTRRIGTRTSLVAFVEPVANTTNVDELREHLRTRLPEWMVPARIVLVDALPRTTSGKIDLRELGERPLGGEIDGAGNGDLHVLLATVLGHEIDLRSTFLAQGGDSFALLQFVVAAKARGITISTADLAERPLAEVLGQTRSDDAMPAERLRADGEEILRSLKLSELPTVPPSHPRRVLLTGATGFLGSYLLHELLARTDAEVYCLVRCGTPDEGRARLGIASRRVHVVPGDLGLYRLGLAAPDWETLADHVDAIYHGAARVNLVLPYDELRRDNVLGTAEVLRLANHGRPKRMHYVSTLSVFVATDRNSGVLLESDHLEQVCLVHGGYAQSKFAAEWLVRRAGPATIYRPGLITGDSRTGQTSPNDFLTLFLRGLQQLGCYPDCDADALFLDVTPVNFAAAALVHLSRGHSRDTVFHVAGAGRWSLADLVAGLRRHGLALDAVSPDLWKDRLQQLDPLAAAACLALCRCFPDGAGFPHHRTMDLFQATGVSFDMRATHQGLAGSGMACPAATPELLVRYITHAFSPRTLS